jgi:hypothetical protein
MHALVMLICYIVNGFIKNNSDFLCKGLNNMESKYYSFLVRLWTSGNGDSTWHISIESSKTGEKQIFVNLEDLHEFFRNLTDASSVLNKKT